MLPTKKRDVLEAEANRLEGLLASLDSDWAHLPKLLALTLFALPLGWLWDVGSALAFVALILSLTATVVYLIGVRRKEYRYELMEVRALLRGLTPSESGRS